MSDHQRPSPEGRSRPRIAPSWVGRLLCPSAIGALTLGEDTIEVDGLVRSPPLSFLGLRDFPVLREGRVWSTIAVTVAEKTSTLRGLNRAQARHFIAITSVAIKTSLTAACTRHGADLQRLSGELTQYSLRFFRQSQMNDWLPGIHELANVLQSPILRSYADDDTRVAIDRLKAFLDDSEGMRTRWNDAFVARELDRYQLFFETVERQPLTPMQRLACVVNEDRNLVLAGAGSGKTSVIVGRAGYLVASGHARPAEVLILAFGHKASQETDERIGERLPGTPEIATYTFHALGRTIIGQATGRMPAVSKLAEDPEVFSRYLLETIQQLSKEHNRYGQQGLCWVSPPLAEYRLA
jgi:DNA helicase IV